MNNWIKATKFNFLKHARLTIAVSLLVFIGGSYYMSKERSKVFGMDFTGGYALNVELAPLESATDYRALLEKALLNHGISGQDFQIRQLTPHNKLRLFMSKTLFDTLPTAAGSASSKLASITQVLSTSDLTFSDLSIEHLEKSWSEVSGQMSKTMRNGALIGLGLALLCILVYITIRFEFVYAVSATLCTIHDVLFALAAIAILHAFGVAVQIDLHTIAAIMTIIGYSLNDTIIVFDRIREDMQTQRRASLKEIINQALNSTLSRTLMTSITTLAVLIPLILLGGSTIFGFALVMAIGVVFGTLSSLFIASPMVLFLLEREHREVRGIATEH